MIRDAAGVMITFIILSIVCVVLLTGIRLANGGYDTMRNYVCDEVCQIKRGF